MPKAKVSATIVGSHVGACATSDCEISFESDAGLAPTAVDAAGVFQVSEGKSTANAVFISENSTLVIKGYAIVASTATCLAQDPRPKTQDPIFTMKPPAIKDVYAMGEGRWNICVAVVRNGSSQLLRSPEILVDLTAPLFAGAISVSGNNTLTPSLSWPTASDNYATASEIKYQVRVSESQLGTITDALTIGEFREVQPNSTAVQMSDLIAGKTYYAVVIATDRAGNAKMMSQTSFLTGPAVVVTPSFSVVAPGTYGIIKFVTITTSTDGAAIYYTVDGLTTPSSSTLLYTGPVSVSSTLMIKAIAIKAGYTESGILSGTFTIDTTAPSAPVITSASGNTGTGSTIYTKSLVPAVAGTAEANSTIIIYNGGVSLGTATANGSGAWTYTPGSNLTAGNYTLTAKATDAAANQSLASNAVALTIDATAPSAPVISTIGSKSGATVAVNAANPAIVGTAEANSTVTVYSNAASIGTVVADGSGAWTFTSALAVGSYTITAKATDVAGNQGAASTAVALTIDTSAPTAPSVTATQSFTTTFNASISVTENDFANFRYALDSISVLTCETTASAVQTSTSNPLSVSITAGANWVLQAIACDTSGNSSSPVTTRSYTYVAPTPTPTPNPTVDTTPPAAPIIFSIASLTVSPATTNNLKPPVVGTAEANATLTLYRTVSGVSSTLATVNVNSIGNWSWTSGTNLSVGTYYITAKATDAAANQSSASSTFTLIIQADSCADDAIPAAPVITSIAGDMTSPAYTNNQKPPVVGTSEAGALVTVYKTIKIEGVSATTTLGTTTASNSGAWTYTPASNLAEGTYDITARITNTSGVNGFEGTPFKLIIDITAPEIAAQVSPATQEFSENFDANVYVSYGDFWWSEFLQIRYALDNVSTLNCSTTSSAVIVSFSKSTTIRVTKAAATTTLRAIICDKAGNASTVSSAVYTRSADSAAETDTTPPPAPTISSISEAGDSSNTNISTVFVDALETGYSTYPTGFNIVGSKEIGSVVTVYANAKAKVIMGGDPWGDTWNFSSQDLPPGNYSITATATDSAGNESVHSAPKTLKVVGLAAPCGGRGMTAYFYMPGLEDGDPVMGWNTLLNGSGTITLSPSVYSASGSHLTSSFGVQLKITNEDGVDKVYGHIGEYQDMNNWPSLQYLTQVTPSYSTSVLKRFEIPYSNVENTATTPLNGTALVHVFCPRERDDLPHNITSLEGRFLPQNSTQPRFTGEAAACGLTNVPNNFSLKQTYLVPSDGYNASFSLADLPVYPSAGRFTSAEVSGVCSVRNTYDRDDPSADNYSFARDVWSFGYGSVPTFGLSWSPAVWDCYSGLWNKSTSPNYPYSNPSIGWNEVDWRKPVSFWVDSGVDPGFYWRASYVMVGNKQQPDVTPWWWFNNVARVPVSKLTTFEVDFKPGFDATPDCSCGLTESTVSTCRDMNGSLRPTLAFKRSTYYSYDSRENIACPGYEDDYSNGAMCVSSSSSSASGSDTSSSSSSSSNSSSSGG